MGVYKCTCCGTNYFSLSSKEAHEKEMTRRRPKIKQAELNDISWNCLYCSGETFRYNHDFSMHLRNAHDIYAFQYTSLANHDYRCVSENLGFKQFQCNTCSANFSSRELLHAHQQQLRKNCFRNHKQQRKLNEMSHYCRYCKASFYSQTVLHDHETEHQIAIEKEAKRLAEEAAKLNSNEPIPADEMYWTSKKTKILIPSLEDDHLINIINYLTRKKLAETSPKYPALFNEALGRGLIDEKGRVKKSFSRYSQFIPFNDPSTGNRCFRRESKSSDTN